METTFIYKLKDITSQDLFGSKAFNLSVLAQHQLKVPEAYCISSVAYDRFINHTVDVKNILSDRNSPLQEKANKILDRVDALDSLPELNAELKSFGVGEDLSKSWAVRSSSTREDLLGSSFAGIYDSFLDIKGEDNILLAVKKCWKSLWSERAIHYYQKINIDVLNNKMAVIVQEMVPADISAVLFTKSPLSLSNNEMMLEYCKGSGDKLASGLITPETCIINIETQQAAYMKGPVFKKLASSISCGP